MVMSPQKLRRGGIITLTRKFVAAAGNLRMYAYLCMIQP